MKLKLCLLTALSLAGLAASATPASAWWLRNHGVNRYSTVVVCRPYNAFTPVCAGSMVCDGCCPFGSPQMPSGVCSSPFLGNPLLGMAQNPLGINGWQQPLAQYPGAVPMQQFQAPAPAPVTMQQQVPMVQPAGYQQAYYPMYYPHYQIPVNVNPYQQAPPAYWYGY